MTIYTQINTKIFTDLNYVTRTEKRVREREIARETHKEGISRGNPSDFIKNSS